MLADTVNVCVKALMMCLVFYNVLCSLLFSAESESCRSQQYHVNCSQIATGLQCRQTPSSHSIGTSTGITCWHPRWWTDVQQQLWCWGLWEQ